MMIERAAENAFIDKLNELRAELSAQVPALAEVQIIGSRNVAEDGLTKTEQASKASIITVACGFRQNDAFSLSPITLPFALTVMTRTELDPTSQKHDDVVEFVADLLSRWHKFGEEMSEAMTSDKFFAGELRMDGGSYRTYDSTTGTWTETLTFSIRGAEKFPAGGNQI